MTQRDVRDLIQAGFEGIAEKYGVHRGYSRACALELLAVLTGQGISFVRPAHLHDPVADWRRKPQPGDALAGANRVRAALYGTGICPLCRTEHALTAAGTLTEHDLPDDDEAPAAGCLGAGLEPTIITRGHQP
ncbi:MAG: hypothetical protein ACRDVE_20585 [Actinocrinis sp.]